MTGRPFRGELVVMALDDKKSVIKLRPGDTKRIDLLIER